MHTLRTKTYKEYYEGLLSDLKVQIASESDDYVITQPTSDLVSYYVPKYCLNEIHFDLNREESIDHKKYITTIPAYKREHGYQHQGDLAFECEKIVVKMPINPNPKLDSIFGLRTQSISISGGPSFSYTQNYILIELEIKGYGFTRSDEQIANEISKTRSEVHALIKRINIEIEHETGLLRQSLTQYIEERKQKLDADKTRLQNLVNLVKIPLERRQTDIIQRIQVQEKSFVQKVKPKPNLEDYVLDREKVIDIIKLLSNQCFQFEKSPATYNKLDEPNLRDLLLANLNSIFEGKATAETFNNKGKTDIYLNIDKGNILIAECKFYGGEKLYHSTIDQILGYLTWRQNFGIMINFCKQKNFSKILTDGETIIKAHASYQSDFRVLTASHFSSKHTLPGDTYKSVEIHHLYFNLFNS